jgi:hypothetical protein
VLRLGIYFNAKKRASFLKPLFTQTHYTLKHDAAAKETHVEIVVLECDDDLEAKGPFDIMLIKLTDLMTTSLYSTDDSARHAALASLERIQAYIAAASLKRHLTIIEPFDRVHVVLDRARIQRLIQETKIHADGNVCTIPEAMLYQRRAAAEGSSASSHELAGSRVVHSPPAIPFPVICKSIAACGTPASHRMYLLRSTADFELMHQHATSIAPPPSPEADAPVWLVQRYMNHGGIIYKVYVLDEEIHVVAKVSTIAQRTEFDSFPDSTKC